MGEISNNIIAALLTLFIIINMIQISVNLIGIDSEKFSGKATVALAGFCIQSNATIEHVDNRTVYTQTPFILDVNTTPTDAGGVFFYDTFELFNITDAGIINFTANETDVGDHEGFLRLNDSCGNMLDEHFMLFTIVTSNRAPVLDNIPDQSINQNELFIYDVNATDPDGDTIRFADNSTFFNIDPITGEIRFTPQQDDVGNKSVNIYVYDTLYATDSDIVNFEIIDVNDAPILDEIGSQTAIINYTYYYDVNATDVDTTLANNLTYGDNSTLFNINPVTGIINFTVPEQNGTYTVNITVNDGELWDWEIISFTVTPENRPPNITYWDPEEYELSMYEGQNLLLTINASDPDGTIPSAQWYIDSGALTGATEYDYSYYAHSGSAGYHNLTVVVSDGELTDSHEWQVYVQRRQIPQTSSPTSSSSSPGPAKVLCMENWRCDEWSTCSTEGIQIRRCKDINECGTVYYKPEAVRNCTYYPQPTCEDGVQNCHHGACEILPDCGGPCPPCPSCSDGILNQGEEGIDCGGPCPACIEIQEPVTGQEPEEEKKDSCGNGICESGELFTCMNDCSIELYENIIVILVIAAIIIIAYRFQEVIMVSIMKFRRLFLIALGKKTPEVLTNKERKGTYTLIELAKLKKNLNKDNLKDSFEKLSEVMISFFSSAISMGGEFTYIDLNEAIKKQSISDDTKKKISNFSMVMTKMEYSGYELNLAEIKNMIDLAVLITESISGMKIDKAVEIGKQFDELDKKNEEEKNELEISSKKKLFGKLISKIDSFRNNKISGEKTEEKKNKENEKEEKTDKKEKTDKDMEHGKREQKEKKDKRQEDKKESLKGAKSEEKEKSDETVSDAKEKPREEDKEKKEDTSHKRTKEDKDEKSRGPLFILNKLRKKKEQMQEVKKENVPVKETGSKESGKDLSEKHEENIQKEMIKEKDSPDKDVIPESVSEKAADKPMTFDEAKANIISMLDEAERLCRLEKYDDAKKIYKDAREVYDGIDKDKRKEMSKETIRFIRLYNEIMSN